MISTWEKFRPGILSLVCLILFLGGGMALAEEKKVQVYGLTPEDYRPYGHFAKPYKQFFLESTEYRGYGRELAEPESVTSVKIGFLGPIEKTVSVATGGASDSVTLGRNMLQGAQLAIEQANERGGFRGSGVPYELVIRNDNGLWGASGNEIVQLTYKDQVRAILGTIDGANSHIAIRTALKLEIPVMNSGDTDPTYSETSIPWAFRCICDDRQMCYLLADFVFKKLKLSRVAALRANSRYSRVGIDEFRDAATRLGFPFLAEINYSPGERDFSTLLQKLKNLNPEVIITYGDALESALVLKQMREMGMRQWFIGSDRMASPEFFAHAGSDLGRVAIGYPYDPQSTQPAYLEFSAAYRQRFGQSPELFAAHAYDGMMMLITAMEKAGLNRAKIRDQLAAMKTYQGVSGFKRFDATFNNVTPAYLGLIENNRFSFYSREEIFE
jgi:branched-chain amino acid transport system substrate-binding protein